MMEVSCRRTRQVGQSPVSILDQFSDASLTTHTIPLPLNDTRRRTDTQGFYRLKE